MTPMILNLVIMLMVQADSGHAITGNVEIRDVTETVLMSRTYPEDSNRLTIPICNYSTTTYEVSELVLTWKGIIKRFELDRHQKIGTKSIQESTLCIMTSY